MKLISWNVNGLRACMNKGFLDFFKQADADIFCVQETKMQREQAEFDFPGYHEYWNSADNRHRSKRRNCLDSVWRKRRCRGKWRSR